MSVGRRDRPLLGLLGALAMIVGFESYLADRHDDFSSHHIDSWQWAGRFAAGDGARSELICLGDSQVKHGVAPAILTERLGLSAWNLAVFQGHPASSFFLLRRALDAGARPAAILVDGEFVVDHPRSSTRLWAELLRPAEAIDLARESGDAAFSGSLFVVLALPSARMRHEIAANLGRSLRGEPPFRAAALGVSRRNWRSNRGAQIQSDFPDPAQVERFRRDAAIARLSYRVDPVGDRYVRRLLRLAGSRSIPVYWVVTPVHPDFRSLQERERVARDRETYLRSLLAAAPNLVVLHGRHAGYDRIGLMDVAHLNAAGAADFTGDLAAAIADDRARLATGAGRPRWVELAPSGTGAPAVALEDLAGSLESLRSERRARARR